MSLRYPDPGAEFTRRWFGWMEKYGTTPVAMDVCMDVLQFRDHVMTYEECAERLRHDIRLAKSLGFPKVRVLSIVPIEVIVAALPVAEALDIQLGKEIHQPMRLEGQQVGEILDVIDRTGTMHLGVVPDLGIYQFRPSEVQLAWYGRRGAQDAACEAAVDLALLLRRGEAAFGFADVSFATAGNLRSDFHRFLATGECHPALADAFHGVRDYADKQVDNPGEIDYTVVSEALMLSHTSVDVLRELAPHISHIHGKFNNMSAVPDRPGQFQEISIDYPAVIDALKAGGYDGYINSEYEGQRYFQDRGRDDLMDEIDQVRHHHEMLRRLIAS